jgi:hypothetical protein
MSNKPYRPQTKSSDNAVCEGDFDTFMGKLFIAFECANIVWFKSSNASISSRKELIRFASGRPLKIPQGRMVSSTPAALAIPHEELLPQLQQYCFNNRMVRMLQREPIFDELQYLSHRIYFVHDLLYAKVTQNFHLVNSREHLDVVLRG